MSKRLDFGCVWINTHIPLVAEMPHGGFKRSGYGKDLSQYGFDDYTPRQARDGEHRLTTRGLRETGDGFGVGRGAEHGAGGAEAAVGGA